MHEFMKLRKHSVSFYGIDDLINALHSCSCFDPMGIDI